MDPSPDTKIAEMDFVLAPWGRAMSTRIRNGLQRGGVMTLGQLLQYTKEDLDYLDEGLGVVCQIIIIKKLKSMGLSLKQRKDL